jgi:hypothetical protein
LRLRAPGADAAVATIEVNDRPTPAARHDASVEVLVDEGMTVHAALHAGGVGLFHILTHT